MPYYEVDLQAGGQVGTLRYGFFSEPDSAVATALGLTQITNSTTALGLIFGSSRPKPPRFGRRIASGFQSSFISADATTTATNAGFRRRNSGRGFGSPGSTTLSRVSVIRNFNGIDYGWNQPITAITQLGALRATLGVVDATSTDTIVIGANFPKPALVVRANAVGAVAGATTAASVSTFADPDSIANVTGIRRVNNGSFTDQDLRRRFAS